jgi:phosphonate transport system permease protein
MAAMSARPAHGKPFQSSWTARAGWLVLLAYLAWTLGSLDFSWTRFVAGLDQGARFIHRMWPPNFAHWDLLSKGLIESLQMALLASFLGVVISLPLGLAAARNLMPGFISWPVRMLIIACRSFHPVIVAIIAVKAVGFGALAGIVALTFGSVGFVAKLFAEAIEEISMKQIEAVRTTGASFANVVIFGVLPQVLPRFVGFCAYETDANLRNSTLVGLVGAGGIGGTLFAAFQGFDYAFVFAIVLAIIALIAVGEVLQAAVKKVFGP